jgi:uncharacterized membrane protein YesL
VPLGTAALLVLAALLVNLLFLTGRSGVPAFLLLVGTLLLLALWGMAMLSLVPVLALRPHLPVPEQLRTALALAFARPLSALGLVLGAVLLVTGLVQVWLPLAVLAAPVVGHLSLARARRHLPSASWDASPEDPAP